MFSSFLAFSFSSLFSVSSFFDFFPFPIPNDTIFQPFFTGHWYEGVQHFLSLHWWITTLLKAYEEEPGHVIIEILCVLIIFFLLFRTSYDPNLMNSNKLSTAEENELLNTWQPDSLSPEIPQYFKNKLIPSINEYYHNKIRMNSIEYLNYSSMNFLGLANTKEIKDAAKSTIERYGVGSCGPRGFYGSFDVHLQVEQAIRDFMKFPACILYSDAIACLASVIPAFSKRGDLIIADENINFGIQQGLTLSRSDIIFFKHNDLQDLSRILAIEELKEKKSKKKLIRKFIVVEGIYQSHGDLAPLIEIVKLKNQYKYRIILDDSLGFGVLGDHGRGSLEHWNLSSDDVDIVCGSLDTALATVGGFCVSSDQIVDHQRLSGAGYCFSAASPPYCSAAGIVNVGILEKHPELVQNLKLKSIEMRQLLSSINGIRVEGNENSSPAIHMRLDSFGIFPPTSIEEFNSIMLEYHWIADRLRDQHQILVVIPDYIPAEHKIPNPSMRLFITVLHERKELEKTAKAIKLVIGEYYKKQKGNK